VAVSPAEHNQISGGFPAGGLTIFGSTTNGSHRSEGWLAQSDSEKDPSATPRRGCA